ncbi:MAG TPA: winged helix-turn-helix domain-containing protein, partial [Caulobacteraceae bacterium]
MTPTPATPWRPRLPEGDAPVYARLVSALEADIAAGALPPDTRLPTHRQLADDLGLGVGTVTKAYAEAEAKGLITARVGRGSFVAPHRRLRPVPSESGGVIDLGRNLPPMAP